MIGDRARFIAQPRITEPSTSSWPACSTSSAPSTHTTSPSGKRNDDRTLALQRRPFVCSLRIRGLRNHPEERMERNAPLRRLLLRPLRRRRNPGRLGDVAIEKVKGKRQVGKAVRFSSVLPFILCLFLPFPNKRIKHMLHPEP